MATIHIQPAQGSGEVLRLVRSALDSEVAKLELAVAMAEKRLAPFEAKYGVTSKHFFSEMSAEDLQGKDDEYVQWAGEYQLIERLRNKLRTLHDIDFNDPSLLRSD